MTVQRIVFPDGLQQWVESGEPTSLVAWLLVGWSPMAVTPTVSDLTVFSAPSPWNTGKTLAGVTVGRSGAVTVVTADDATWVAGGAAPFPVISSVAVTAGSSGTDLVVAVTHGIDVPLTGGAVTLRFPASGLIRFDGS